MSLKKEQFAVMGKWNIHDKMTVTLSVTGNELHVMGKVTVICHEKGDSYLSWERGKSMANVTVVCYKKRGELL